MSHRASKWKTNKNISMSSSGRDFVALWKWKCRNNNTVERKITGTTWSDFTREQLLMSSASNVSFSSPFLVIYSIYLSLQLVLDIDPGWVMWGQDREKRRRPLVLFFQQGSSSSLTRSSIAHWTVQSCWFMCRICFRDAYKNDEGGGETGLFFSNHPHCGYRGYNVFLSLLQVVRCSCVTYEGTKSCRRWSTMPITTSTTKNIASSRNQSTFYRYVSCHILTHTPPTRIACSPWGYEAISSEKREREKGTFIETVTSSLSFFVVALWCWPTKRKQDRSWLSLNWIWREKSFFQSNANDLVLCAAHCHGNLVLFFFCWLIGGSFDQSMHVQLRVPEYHHAGRPFDPRRDLSRLPALLAPSGPLPLLQSAFFGHYIALARHPRIAAVSALPTH